MVATMNAPVHGDRARAESVPRRIEADVHSAQDCREQNISVQRASTWFGDKAGPPWRRLSWPMLLPLAFAANVAIATLAWFIVGLIVR